MISNLQPIAFLSSLFHHLLKLYLRTRSKKFQTITHVSLRLLRWTGSSGDNLNLDRITSVPLIQCFSPVPGPPRPACLKWSPASTHLIWVKIILMEKSPNPVLLKCLRSALENLSHIKTQENVRNKYSKSAQTHKQVMIKLYNTEI